MRDTLTFSKSKNLDVFVLGGGSNIIVPDRGFSGVVLQMATAGLSIQQDGTVTAEAGVPWDDLVAECCKRGLAGIEALSGIPGLVGATPIQNVGAYGQEVSQVIASVEALDRQSLKVVSIPAQDCQFGYRQSRFKAKDINKWIITAVTFKLSPTEVPTPKYEDLRLSLISDTKWNQANRTEKLTLIRQHVLAIRAAKGMVLDSNDPDTRSVGSFFMNPVVSNAIKENILKTSNQFTTTRPFIAHQVGDDRWKLSAAWLIENSGIKRGQAFGGAKVSTKHVLALTNPGHATSSDILALADFISDAVVKKFGVRLEREPVVIA